MQRYTITAIEENALKNVTDHVRVEFPEMNTFIKFVLINDVVNCAGIINEHSEETMSVNIEIANQLLNFAGVKEDAMNQIVKLLKELKNNREVRKENIENAKMLAGLQQYIKLSEPIVSDIISLIPTAVISQPSYCVNSKTGRTTVNFTDVQQSLIFGNEHDFFSRDWAWIVYDPKEKKPKVRKKEKQKRVAASIFKLYQSFVNNHQSEIEKKKLWDEELCCLKLLIDSRIEQFEVRKYNKSSRKSEVSKEYAIKFSNGYELKFSVYKDESKLFRVCFVNSIEVKEKDLSSIIEKTDITFKSGLCCQQAKKVIGIVEIINDKIMDKEFDEIMVNMHKEVSERPWDFV